MEGTPGMQSRRRYKFGGHRGLRSLCGSHHLLQTTLVILQPVFLREESSNVLHAA